MDIKIIKVKIGSSGGSHMVYWMSNMIKYRLPTEVMRSDCGTDGSLHHP